MPVLAYVPDNLTYETKCIKIITDSVAYTLECNKISCVVSPKHVTRGNIAKGYIEFQNTALKFLWQFLYIHMCYELSINATIRSAESEY